MCLFPAHSPGVPYQAYIPGGLQVGSNIKIKGRMLHMADRFTIDLQCGGRSYFQDDIALHLSVRPSEMTIVRNSFQYHSWGPEERFGLCPVSRGELYDIDIYVEPGSYSIKVNGYQYCHFSHRIPISRVSHIRIAGETTLHYVGIEYRHHDGFYPSASKPPRVGAAIIGAIIGGAIGVTAAIHRPSHHHTSHHHGPPHFGPPHFGPPHFGPHHHGPLHHFPPHGPPHHHRPHHGPAHHFFSHHRHPHC